MIEIGDMPILWHIMKMYSYYGYHEFIICCGYKAHVIKEYFADYYLHRSDITFDFTQQNKMEEMCIRDRVDAAVQGVLVTGAAVYSNQIVKQIKKD